MIDEWFLDSGASTHFTPFESDFVSMTQGNYGHVETANSKAPLFMVAVGTILIEHEIIDPQDRSCYKPLLSPSTLSLFFSFSLLFFSIYSMGNSVTLCDIMRDKVTSKVMSR